MIKNIENGEYDFIIGIDASARIPTLLVSNFIKHVYEKNGFEFPRVRFVAGNPYDHFKKDKETAEWLKKEVKQAKKVLIVEETLISGDSIKFLCKNLKKLGIPFDVATLVAGNLDFGQEDVVMRTHIWRFPLEWGYGYIYVKNN